MVFSDVPNNLPLLLSLFFCNRRTDVFQKLCQSPIVFENSSLGFCTLRNPRPKIERRQNYGKLLHLPYSPRVLMPVTNQKINFLSKADYWNGVSQIQLKPNDYSMYKVYKEKCRDLWICTRTRHHPTIFLRMHWVHGTVSS